MEDTGAPADRSGAHITEFVTTALQQDSLGGLCELLRYIAQSSGADACLLWRLAPGSDLGAVPREGRLFVVAQWLEDGSLWTAHNLHLNSLTAQGITSRRPMCVGDILQARVDSMESLFLRRIGVATFCSVPITFLDSQPGAVNVYRRSPHPFQEQHVVRVEQLAALVPSLYQTICDKVSFSLMRSVNESLKSADRLVVAVSARQDSIRSALQGICDLVGKTFQCLEASIFLEDRFGRPGTFEAFATTWPEMVRKQSYTKEESALTSWSLKHGRSISLFDLADTTNHKEAAKIREQYVGLAWADSVNIREAVRVRLGISQDDQMPPLSFMAAPILMGSSVLGAIRCCAAIRAPYYFAEREVRMLELVGAQVGQYWANWQARRAAEKENRAWSTFVRGVSKMNLVVQNDLRSAVLNEPLLLAKALELAQSVIAGADVLDIRLLDKQTQELYYAATLGTGWELRTPEERQARLAQRFPIGGDEAVSIASKVVHHEQPYVFRDLVSGPNHEQLLPEITQMISAPVPSQDGVVGVLDVRGCGSSDFPQHAVSIAELLGQQLGLYRYLATLIRELRTAQHELTSLLRAQTETYQDLGHQLKSPIFQAEARIRSLLRSATLNEGAKGELAAVRGLVAKAKRVSMNIRRLTGNKIEMSHPSALGCDDLVRTVIEHAKDYHVLLGVKRGIKFRVEPNGFEVLRRYEVLVDHDLLEQAISNVLDNAFKYSFPGTTVRVHGGLTGSGRFHLSVTNEGIRLRASEVDRCKERGWRSEDAEATTGEGSGLGLWIVDQIMKAHNGELLVVPTTATNLTEVRVLFPARKP